MGDAAFEAAGEEGESAPGVGEEDRECGVAVEDAGENHAGYANGSLKGETWGS